MLGQRRRSWADVVKSYTNGLCLLGSIPPVSSYSGGRTKITRVVLSVYMETIYLYYGGGFREGGGVLVRDDIYRKSPIIRLNIDI